MLAYSVPTFSKNVPTNPVLFRHLRVIPGFLVSIYALFLTIPASIQSENAARNFSVAAPTARGNWTIFCYAIA